VWVSGQGGEKPSRDLIRSNEHYLGDAAYFPERYGDTIVPALLDLIAGKDVQPLLLIEPAWLDASTIGELYPE
jgi:ribose transport system substrate-binding protein